MFFSEVTCSTRHVVYLLTCYICSERYVGKTDTPPAQRLSRHRSQNAVFKHAARDRCCELSIEVLQLIRPGEDIQSIESLWIEALNPEINKENDLFGQTDLVALENHYNLNFFKLLDGK